MTIERESSASNTYYARLDIKERGWKKHQKIATLGGKKELSHQWRFKHVLSQDPTH